MKLYYTTLTTVLFLILIFIFGVSKIVSQGAVAFKANDTSTTTSFNHRPTVFNMHMNATTKGPVAFALNASDPEEDQIHFNIVAKPADGNISSFDSSSGGGVYSPGCSIKGDNHERQDSFAFNAVDSNGASSLAATVTIKFPPGIVLTCP